MIDETKLPYSRRLVGRALLGSTQSCHFATKKTGAARSSAGYQPTAGDERRR